MLILRDEYFVVVSGHDLGVHHGHALGELLVADGALREHGASSGAGLLEGAEGLDADAELHTVLFTVCRLDEAEETALAADILGRKLPPRLARVDVADLDDAANALNEKAQHGLLLLVSREAVTSVGLDVERASRVREVFERNRALDARIFPVA